MAYLELELPLDFEEEVLMRMHLTPEKGLDIQLGREEDGVFETRIVIKKEGRKVIISVWPKGKDIDNDKESQETTLFRLSGKDID